HCEAAREKDQHQNDERFHTSVRPAKLVPYQQTPKRADHGCALTYRIADRWSDLYRVGRAGRHEIGDSACTPDDAADPAERMLFESAVEIIADLHRVAFHRKIHEKHVEHEGGDENPRRENHAD